MTLIPPGSPAAVEVNPDFYGPSLLDQHRHMLEWFLIFSICVANKPAEVTREKVSNLLCLTLTHPSPFDQIRGLLRTRQLGWSLRRARLGQYRRIGRALRGIIDLDPSTCTLEDLEAIHGIGPKTARFFLLHSRGGQYAVLDTHILHWLRDLGYDGIPRSTPPAGARYAAIERTVLALAKQMGCDPAGLDAMIWERYSKSRGINGGMVNATSTRTVRVG